MADDLTPLSHDPAYRGPLPPPTGAADARTNRGVAVIKRISWGAIFAGVIVALVTQLGLSLLGLGFGLNAYNPASDGSSLGSITTGTGIWLAISSLISLFAGGYVASHLSGMPVRQDGILHGIVTWGLVTLLTFYLMTTAVGRILSGAVGILGEGAQLAGRGVAAVAPEAARVAGRELGLNDLTLQDIQQEAVLLLRQTGKPELQPENLRQEGQQAAETAQGAVTSAAQTPQQAEEELQGALARLLSQGRDVASEVDREAVVNVLVARTDMSREEARRTVRQWEQTYHQTRQQVGETFDTLGQRATVAAEDVTDAMGKAALWAFFAMMLGALAATGGGYAGVPRDLASDPTVPNVT